MPTSKSVLVLLGGDSPERDVSLRSGKAVYDALVESGFSVDTLDPADGIETLRNTVHHYDIVLPILHGKNGEDGTIQSELESLGAKYLGTDSLHSAKCFDKKISHEILERHGIRMPKSEIVNKKTLFQSALYKKPFVLKPIDGGSSVDTIIVRDNQNITVKIIRELFNRHDELLLEELIVGLELTVPILGKEALPVIAIVPPEGAEFDYENKYNGKTREICPIPEVMLSTDLQKEAQQLALNVHKILQARHLSRVDMIYSNKGEFVILELNTIPGLTNQSLFPNSAKVIGYDMSKLVKTFVELVEGDK